MNSFAETEVLIPRGTKLPLMTAGEFARFRPDWVIFFSSVYSMQEHPGMNRENAHPKTVAECAEVADKMMLELMKRSAMGIA